MRSKRIIKNEDLAPFCMPYFECDVFDIKGSKEDLEQSDDSISGDNTPIVENIQQHIEQIEKEAYERGFTAGERAGFEVGEQKAYVLLKKLEDILREVSSIKERILKDLEPQIFNFSVSLARRIIIEELSIRPEIITTIIKEALKKIEKTGTIKIKVSPSVYSIISKVKHELLSVHPDIVFDVDHSITAPVIAGPEQEIITDIDEQIKNILEDIRNGHS